MSFTEAQQKAIEARGNVLVVAGAGAGKTSTLVERCVSRVLDPVAPVGVDEILMVTFTEAAAAEMKQRIRQRLGQTLESSRDAGLRSRIEEQLALLDLSRIGTLHGFCLQLIREHGHELAVDPRMTVLAEEQSAVLMEEALDEIFRKHYAGKTESGPVVQELVIIQAGGKEEIIRSLILKLHHYTQTLPDPAGWFRSQLDQFRRPDPEMWRGWLMEAFHEWRSRWLPELSSQAADNNNAHQIAKLLSALGESPSRAAMSKVMEEIAAVDQVWPPKNKTRLRDPIKDLFAEALFLGSVARVESTTDPLAEDWNWVRGQMGTLLNLAMEFGNSFAAAKHAEGALDFHDFEQFALRLLWDNSAGRPTPLADAWRRRFKLVFVDEYQDINAAQNRIIEAVSRGGLGSAPASGAGAGASPATLEVPEHLQDLVSSDALEPSGEGAGRNTRGRVCSPFQTTSPLSGDGTVGNRFLVGDVKQSIYRFRLSDPRIFQELRNDWAPDSRRGVVLSLAENFRSREKLLHFFNPIFAELMREEIGGVVCGPEDELKFGAPEERKAVSANSSPEPRVEVHLRLKESTEEAPENSSEDEGNGSAEVAEAGDTEIEAGLVARRLRELMEEGHRVWDEAAQAFRPVRWGDMVVLLRSVRSKAEIYAKEFNRQGVPLEAERGGFYENTEITDLLSLLQLLDNPIQDVPLLAVLRSPLVGLSLNELAAIRLANRHDHFWTALRRWQETEGKKSDEPGGAGFKVGTFLKRYSRWRRLARETSLSHRIEAVLDETNYRDWLLAQPRGEQRLANVRHLLVLAQQFDPFQRQGLQRFLRFVEAQRGAQVDSEPPSVEAENAVRLMSIHKSKGLEFPVVVLAGLGARFNLRDLSDHVVLDEEYGLCPRVKPPQTGSHYPSLPWWLARQHQRREALGEELRLLYVAMTRARDTLLLAGTAARRKAELWGESAAGRLTDRQILKVGTSLDWLGPLLARSTGTPDWIKQPRGEADLFRWIIQDEGTVSENRESARESAAGPNHDGSPIEISPAQLRSLRERIEWQYPFAAAERVPAKTSVSLLRRRAGESDGEARQLFPSAWGNLQRKIRPADGGRREGMSSAEIGSAHHLFLELVQLEYTGTRDELSREADRLVNAGILSPEEHAALDLDALSSFWQTDLGRSIREQHRHVHREMPFTARMSPTDLGGLGLPMGLHPDDEEFLVVQGVVDLAVILPGEIRIVDFKTDRVTSESVGEKVRHYAPQLKLYGRALGRIYRRPVTEQNLHFLALNQTVRL